MVRVRITERDPSLAHQINLHYKARDQGITLVKCNCRPDPLGEVPTGSDVMAIYNNPNLHSHHREVFVPRKHHTANAKVYDIE